MAAIPPPLPSRPNPSGRLPEGAIPGNFSPLGLRISTRDVQRATGSMEGMWVSFDSTNVEMAKVIPNTDGKGGKTGTGTITIRFINGWEYEYQNRPMADWYDLVESSSKGRFTYYEVRGPGKSVSGQTLWPYSRKTKWIDRSAAEIARMKAAREPMHAEQQRRTYTRGGKRGAYGAGGLPVPRAR